MNGPGGTVAVHVGPHLTARAAMWLEGVTAPVPVPVWSAGAMPPATSAIDAAGGNLERFLPTTSVGFRTSALGP